jgi:hypothetical protein
VIAAILQGMNNMNYELELAQMKCEMAAILNQYKGTTYFDLSKRERTILRTAMRALNVEMVLQGQDETVDFKAVV